MLEMWEICSGLYYAKSIDVDVAWNLDVHELLHPMKKNVAGYLKKIKIYCMKKQSQSRKLPTKP